MLLMINSLHAFACYNPEGRPWFRCVLSLHCTRESKISTGILGKVGTNLPYHFWISLYRFCFSHIKPRFIRGSVDSCKEISQSPCFYRANDQEITVIRILHKTQDIVKILNLIVFLSYPVLDKLSKSVRVCSRHFLDKNGIFSLSLHREEGRTSYFEEIPKSYGDFSIINV